jgi:hypothetical protein
MKTFITALAAVALTAVSAHAADIYTKSVSGINVPVVFIKGEITEGDAKKFDDIVKNMKVGRGVVVLNSPGGITIQGLVIGETIRKAKFETVASGICASTCGLMWLAGVKRWAFDTAKIGFHSSYNKETEKTSGGANAVIGAYLSALGFKYDTIYYLTNTAPDSMEWLTYDKAKEHRIAVTPLKSKPKPEVVAKPVPPPPEPEHKWMPPVKVEDYKVTEPKVVTKTPHVDFE